MENLIAYIKAQNEKSRAWVAADPQNRMAGLLCEDAAHWQAYGIDTVEKLENYLDSEAQRENAEDILD